MRKRGFSYLEALLTMFLVAAVFGAVLALLRDSVHLVNYSNEKDSAGVAAQVGLERMSNELWEAVLVDTPAPAAANSDLIFAKVDPTSTTRLTAPAPFDPYDPSFLLTVHYHVVGEQLIRDVGPRGGAPTMSMAVAEHVTGLQVTQVSRGVYYLVISVRAQNQVSSIATTVTCLGVQ